MVSNLQAVLDLDRCGVQVVSIREPWLDTGSAVRPLLIAIFGWVAEQERVTIVARTKAGLERARRSGARLGRPPLRGRNQLPVANLKSVFTALPLPHGCHNTGAGQGCGGTNRVLTPTQACVVTAGSRDG
jgi:hypothetical protein